MELFSLGNLESLIPFLLGGGSGGVILALIKLYVKVTKEDEKTAQRMLQKSRERSDDLRRENDRKSKVIYDLRAENYELKRKNEILKERLEHWKDHSS